MTGRLVFVLVLVLVRVLVRSTPQRGLGELVVRHLDVEVD